jgi:hypothetical protein
MKIKSNINQFIFHKFFLLSFSKNWSHIYIIYSILQLKLSHQKSIKLKFIMNTLMLNHCSQELSPYIVPLKVHY